MKVMLFALVVSTVICYVAIQAIKPDTQIKVIDRMPVVEPVRPVRPVASRRVRRESFHHSNNYFTCKEPNIFGG